MKPPRRSKSRDAVATRRAILDAARRNFAIESYDRVGLREIAAEAQIDPALIIRQFGSKDKLFEEVLVEGLLPKMMQDDPSKFGERVMRAYDEPARGDSDHFVLLLRAANMPNELPRIRDIISDHLMTPLMACLEGSDIALRAKLLTVLATGFAIHGIVAHDAPLPGPEVERFRQISIRLIQALTDGDEDLLALLGGAVAPAVKPDRS